MARIELGPVDRDAARGGLPGQREVSRRDVDVAVGRRVVEHDRAADVEHDDPRLDVVGCRDVGIDREAGQRGNLKVPVVHAVAQRAGDRAGRIGGERGDVIHLALQHAQNDLRPAAGGERAGAFGAGKGGDWLGGRD